jgi:hypothetical protein
MRGRATLALCVAATCVALGAITTLRASDHLDGPRTTADPQADLTDVFAFTSPENPAHIVLAMTVAPFAGPSATFSSRVDYAFRVRRVSDTQPPVVETTTLDVVCHFEGADGSAQGHVTCSSPDGASATALVGDATGGGSSRSAMRVFAGARSDPAFFDRQGALATLATGRASFTGQNTFAGANVLAIVVELNASAFAPEAGSPPSLLAVSAETVRSGR